MEDKIKLVLHNVQQHVACHQKYLKILENCYHKAPMEDFLKVFFKYLKTIFHMDIVVRNPHVERTLDFLAQFVCSLIKSNEDKTPLSLEEDLTSNTVLTRVIYETLKYHDLAYVQARYHSCRFITLILKHTGYETQLDSDICDAIEEAMLERILDPKASIRLQAVMALVRLQEPINPDCPVIKAYQSLLIDANPSIRREVVKVLAPNATTIPKISERVSDVDCQVRIAAYTRCADIGPMLFKIVKRQQILKCGFQEENKQVKNIFLKNLLPKWLTAYNGNILGFLSGLKLDADENDLLNTEELSKQIMEVFFKTVPVKEIIDFLPVDDSRLIPPDNLSSEVIIYWSNVAEFLRSSDETEEFLEQVVPELTSFCNYIQNIIDSKTSEKMQEWEYLDLQYILYNLFDMAEQYDFSDEVGRRTLHKLVMSSLQNHKLQFKLAKKVLGIAEKLIANVDIFTNEICQIISDIKEPLVDKHIPQAERADCDFQIAELKVKVNILQGDIEDALDNQDFQKASVIQNDLMEYRRKLEDLSKPTEVVKVRMAKDDPETVCRCLDLLSALLQFPNMTILSPSLVICKSEFLMPLLTSSVVEINWRVLRCIALYSLLDKSIAEEHIKVLCIPIATYRAIPNYNKSALITSVSAVCDIMRYYGSEIFGSSDDVNSTASQHNTTRRRLYRSEDGEDVNIMEQSRMNVEFILEIILDMLDDENEEIRETAITAIAKLILTEFPVNHLIISRIILKWFNPLTEKTADKMQQKLGVVILNYTKLIKGAREVIEKAVIPTLTGIANAPRTSPLADIDIDNVLRFFAAITDSNDTMDIVHIHTKLAQSICRKIASKPSDPVVLYLSKLLLHLDIPSEKSTIIKELITQGELLLDEEEEILPKGPRKHITKFVEKLEALNNLTNDLDVIIEHTAEGTEDDINKIEEASARTEEEIYITPNKNRDTNIQVSEDSIEDNRKDRQENLAEDEDTHLEKEVESKGNKKVGKRGKKNNVRGNKGEDKEEKRNSNKIMANGNMHTKKSVKEIEENASDTDSSSVVRRTSKRRGINNKKINGIKVLTNVVVREANNPKTDSDSSRSAGEQILQQRINTRSKVKDKDEKQKSTEKRPLKRTRQEKHNKNEKQFQSVMSKSKDRKKKNNNSDLTDKEMESDTSKELRSSKRAKKNKDVLSSSDTSRDSEKENSEQSIAKRVPPLTNEFVINSVDVDRIRGSVRDLSINLCPIAESTRNNSHKTLGNNTVNASTEQANEESVNGIKRRKSRGKKSQDLDSTDDPTLHTIIEQSQRTAVLDDNTLLTSTSRSSSRTMSLRSSQSRNSSPILPSATVPRRSRTIVSETSSDSESGSGTPTVRRSARKIKKKNT